MFEGTVKWFESKKGYGFITPDAPQGIPGMESNEKKDIFVHFSDIQGNGYRTLKDGDKVTFETATGDKGLKAVKVTAVTQ